jgi:hypothetical protein
MKPGEILTCANPHCGAQARARSTRPENWKDGYALLLEWPDGRQEATVAAPARCLACHERFEALGADLPPPRRPGPMRELAIAASSAVPPGEAFLVGVVEGSDGKPQIQAVKIQQLALF